MLISCTDQRKESYPNINERRKCMVVKALQKVIQTYIKLTSYIPYILCT